MKSQSRKWVLLPPTSKLSCPQLYNFQTKDYKGKRESEQKLEALKPQGIDCTILFWPWASLPLCTHHTWPAFVGPVMSSLSIRLVDKQSQGRPLCLREIKGDFLEERARLELRMVSRKNVDRQKAGQAYSQDTVTLSLFWVCLKCIDELLKVSFTGPDIALFLPALCMTDINSWTSGEILLA